MAEHMDDASPEQPESHEPWVRSHPYAAALMAGFVVGGMVCAPLIFPDVPLWRTIVGGALFGVFCAFCVALPRFLD